ncbi:MAG: NADH-quinone oxidoreductase subunit M [Sporocytophaga sp.]|uniref:complex I subunit 4 family protein n=1 Tax=Sporocytophaga sp. TaxID=2231183 RepID=UPI001B167796|nr:NADH-quinone oxidoreductase subunit M [Sporocytophaga sp.]MBO9700706.1 NADH-quinone oxidoreductase subunit M [Sporocytophaga sp.]
METSILIFLPLVAGLISFLLPDNRAKQFAFVAALAEFAYSLVLLLQFNPQETLAYATSVPWVKSMGISFSVGMDGISILLVMLTTFLIPLIILSSFRRTFANSNYFYGLVLIMQSALVGVFVARDAFLFYVFWELALIPIYFIALIWGGENRKKITFKFFVYTLAGSLLMLVAIIYLYLQTPNGSFDINQFYAVGSTLSSTDQALVFVAFFLAFAIKMPIFPFHTWQPDTYTVTPAQGTMLLSGIMLKMGIYGVIRWILPLVPEAAHTYGMPAIILSVIGIIYASIIAIKQKDFKRLIAYVSIAHVGLIAAGIFTLGEESLQGGIIQMLSHGINVVGLFFVIDVLFDRTKTLELSSLGGIRNVAPFFTVTFIILLFSSIALPFTGGFPGEFLLFVGIFQYNPWIAAVAGVSVILGAVYMLSSFQKIMLGETNNLTSGFADLFTSEKLVLIPIIILIFWMGIYPDTFLEISGPAVKALIKGTGTSLSLK